MNRRSVLRNSKRGQLKMLESIAVLIVFFFLVGIGINFYGKMQLQSLKDAKEEFANNDATKISQKIIHLPELRCSLENTDQGSCIDLYQAIAWQDSQAQADSGCSGSDPLDSALCSQRVTHYFEQIGPAEVVLKRVYSSDDTRRAWLVDPSDPRNTFVLYNYTSTTAAAGKAASTFTQIPVVIYDSVEQISELGILQVRVYQ